MIRTTLVLALLAVTGLAQASGDVEAGKLKSQTCAACHGNDGNGTGDGQYPRIAGQHADYLAKVLTDYRSGARKNAIMAGMAGTLSDADIANLAAYFSAQSSPLHDLSAHKQ